MPNARPMMPILTRELHIATRAAIMKEQNRLNQGRAHCHLTS